jgi:hypothetical protein
MQRLVEVRFGSGVGVCATSSTASDTDLDHARHVHTSAPRLAAQEDHERVLTVPVAHDPCASCVEQPAR